MTTDGNPGTSDIELSDSRDELVGRIRVRRALPRKGLRTVGAWCFADHLGPASVTEDAGLDVGPHPHTGLQTVTWIVQGQVLHRDSLGSEQVIAPGQLNLMTAGWGVSHSEEATGRYAGPLHGIQLWIAQPEATRAGAAAFEHHATLPAVALGAAVGGGGAGEATVLVGELDGVASPARHDTPLVGAELRLAGAAEVPLRADWQYGLVVLEGAVRLDGGDEPVGPGRLAHLRPGRTAISVDPAPGEHGAPARVMLLGGEPFTETLLMWWNYVARSRDEVDAAHTSWNADDGRFGTVASPLPRIPSRTPFWSTSAR
ncbi:MAG: pirin family protein [Acidimicrobiia bacterium]